MLTRDETSKRAHFLAAETPPGIEERDDRNFNSNIRESRVEVDGVGNASAGIEVARLRAAKHLGLRNVSDRSVPQMFLISALADSGCIIAVEGGVLTRMAGGHFDDTVFPKTAQCNRRAEA